MTKIYNKKTGKYEIITKPEDIPAVSWAEVMNCGGNEEKLLKIWIKGNEEKITILKELKQKEKMTVKEYYKVKERLRSENMTDENTVKKEQLRGKIQKGIDDIENMQNVLQKDIEELYVLEKGTDRPIGWKRKGRELHFEL